MGKESKSTNPYDSDPFYLSTREIYFGRLDNPTRYLVEALKEGELNIGLISHSNSQLAILRDHYSIRADEEAKIVYKVISKSRDFRRLSPRASKKYLCVMVDMLVRGYQRTQQLKRC